MAIIENQFVELRWNNANRKHYEGLGYSFTKNGDIFIVDIQDLTKGSKALVKAKCDWCDETFTRPMKELNRKGHDHHFCNTKCQHEFRSDIAYKNRPVKNCEQCGEEYKTKHYNYETSRFCSAKCLSDWQSIAFKGKGSPFYVERLIVKCDWCSENLERTPNYLSLRTYNFCNRECQQNWHRNVYVKSEEFIELARKTMLKNLAEGKIKTTETEPHLKINSILDELKIEYKNEKVDGDYSFDIYLKDYDLYIEVNGGYWHCDNRKYSEINYTQQLDRIIKDKRKRTYLLSTKKKRILYLWEHDINNDLEMCASLIIEFIKNHGELRNYQSMNYSVIDGTLKINQYILTPYMDKSFEDIAKITNLEVRKKVTGYDESNYITFDCEYCGNEKTQHLSTYMKAKNHFCSVRCKNLSQQIGNETDQLIFIHQCSECEDNIELPNHRHLKIISGEQKNVFCCYECKYKWESKNKTGKNHHSYNRIERNCKYCDTKYEIPQNQKDRNKYCSVKCRQLDSRKRIKVQCVNCESDVFKTPTDIKKNKTGQYFCSHNCHNEYKRNSNKELRSCEYVHCSKEFTVKENSTKKYCSISCRNKGVALENSSN